MYCKICGKAIPDDSVFCSYCGSKIYAKDSSNSINQQYSSKQNKSSNSGCLGWFLIIILIAVICCCISFFGQTKSNPSSNSSPARPIENIKEQIKENEPETGTILARTFQYQGGGHLIVTAESDSADITVVSTEDDSQYVRFYVRKGETADISIPTGIYTITYQTGKAWYGKETGFGTFAKDGSFEDVFEFTFYQDNAWISNTVWEITV